MGRNEIDSMVLKFLKKIGPLIRGNYLQVAYSGNAPDELLNGKLEADWSEETQHEGGEFRKLLTEADWQLLSSERRRSLEENEAARRARHESIDQTNHSAKLK
jgi:hypothetical protein